MCAHTIRGSEFMKYHEVVFMCDERFLHSIPTSSESTAIRIAKIERSSALSNRDSIFIKWKEDDGSSGYLNPDMSYSDTGISW